MKYTILTVAFILIAMTSLTNASTCPIGVYPCDSKTNFKNPEPIVSASINNNSFNVNNSQFLQGLTWLTNPYYPFWYNYSLISTEPNWNANSSLVAYLSYSNDWVGVQRFLGEIQVESITDSLDTNRIDLVDNSDMTLTSSNKIILDGNKGVDVTTNITVADNVIAEGFIGNGSKLTDVCLTNGTGCITTGINDNVTAWNVTVRNKLAVAEDIYTRNNITAKRIIAINGTHEIGLRIMNLSGTDKIYPAIVSSGNLYFEVNSRKDTLGASPLYPGYVSTTGFNMNDGKGSVFGASLPGVTGVLFDTYNSQTNGTASKYMRSLYLGVPDRDYSVPTYYASKSVLLGTASNYTCNRQIQAQSSPSLLLLPNGCEKNVYGGLQHNNVSINIWTNTGPIILNATAGVNVTGNLNVAGTILTTNASTWSGYVTCYTSGGMLGHCTSVVGVTGQCTCVGN